ncbi:2-deoxy-5-keto-D-gluconate 6-phosphate aldolase domain-containing protein [Roseateles sp.]|uniref:2-deoxy-5-keto-D-gluconate 6-phosphate aldolase domain-containing protein n=1 Tax=Roseateles sp. TaxID=1971397 RepID=UPI003264D5FF
MPAGYTQPLYILPFDHRASFVSGLFGWTGALAPEQTAQVIAAKRVIYDGFAAAVADGINKSKAGVLVDEHFGADILRDAKNGGVITCAPTEKSGQDEFDFEFGADFAQHIQDFAPAFCKVLVRYNPEGDAAVNHRQASRLRTLSEALVDGPSRFMFELLVPATPQQLEGFSGEARAYDRKLRPALMLRAISDLQDAGVEADVWKVEGLDSKADCERIVAMARRDGRASVGCIVLGRGENEQHVRAWLTTAAGVPGFIGFAVGRTTFWEPLIALRDEKITREDAVAEIARRYRLWVSVFEAAKAAARSADSSSTRSPPG